MNLLDSQCFSGLVSSQRKWIGAMAAYSFMIFYLLCAPCFAAMGAIGYMCGFAYAASLIVFQPGGLFTGEAAFGLGTIAALILLAGILFLLFRKGYQGEESIRRLTSAAAAIRGGFPLKTVLCDYILDVRSAVLIVSPNPGPGNP